MQTAPLTFNGRIVTESLLFYFFYNVMKRTETHRNIRDPYFVGIFFFIFWGTLVLKMGDTVGPRYTASKNIHNQLFVYIFFFLNYGQHRTTALYWFPRSIGLRYNGTAVYIV